MRDQRPAGPPDGRTHGPVRVLVVDDQAPFRLAARLVISRTDGFEVAGEATSGEESLDRVAELHPDLVLMDINMGEMSGIDAARSIVADAPHTVVFLCSTYATEDVPPAAWESGAAAYFRKEDFGPSVLSQLWERPVPSR